jgi:hypothetical protein
MPPTLLALICIAAFVPLMLAARWFKTLDVRPWRAVRTPLIAGIVAGAVIRFADLGRSRDYIAIAVLLTLTAVYTRLLGDESELAEGMTLGAFSGAAVAVVLIVFPRSGADDALRFEATALLSGAVAGLGTTWASFHVSSRLRQFLIDVMTAVVAIAVAYVPLALADHGVPMRTVAITIAAGLPFLVFALVFKQWPEVRSELRDEARLGVIDEMEVRRTAHPFLRFTASGWIDPRARRQFVKLANRIALRKRQQRSRPDSIARLYQLEIIKLRMQLQEMHAIDRATRMQAQRMADGHPPHSHDDGELPSDTMARRG